MAKSSFAPPPFTILIYDCGGRRIIGTASMHDPEKTCSLAQSILQLMPEAQPLETVDRDAESAEGTDHEGTRSTPAPTGVGQRPDVPDESHT